MNQTQTQLQTRRHQILEKINQLKKEIEQERENEEVYPSHESTWRVDTENQLQVLTTHLNDIDKQLKNML